MRRRAAGQSAQRGVPCEVAIKRHVRLVVELRRGFHPHFFRRQHEPAAAGLSRDLGLAGALQEVDVVERLGDRAATD